MNPPPMTPTPDHLRTTGARVSAEASEIEAATHVQQMFDTISPTYDRLNHILSVGLDRRWWRRSARAFAPTLARPEATVVDLCCGTGDMTSALLALRPSTLGTIPVTGVDFSPEMLSRARTKHAQANARFLEADALHLPFPDSSVDLITAAFGFRNLANYAAGLAELHRVLRPGGQIGILEANQPGGLVGLGYNLYFHHILPRLGGLLSGRPAAYRYLPASVQRFPRPPRMLELIHAAGFQNATWTPYTLGTAGLYRATK